MAESILYRGHFILATAQFNPATKSWIGRADITDEDNSKKRESYQLIGPQRLHSTERAAQYFMISAARNWIEARLVAVTETPAQASQ